MPEYSEEELREFAKQLCMYSFMDQDTDEFIPWEALTSTEKEIFGSEAGYRAYLLWVEDL